MHFPVLSFDYYPQGPAFHFCGSAKPGPAVAVATSRPWDWGFHHSSGNVNKKNYGKIHHFYGKSWVNHGKSTISMVMFNSYVKLPEGIYIYIYSGDNMINIWSVVWSIFFFHILGIILPTDQYFSEG